MNKKEAVLRAFCETVAGIKLFPYQVKFLNDCLNHDRIVGVFSRQTGKTTCVGLYTLFHAVTNAGHHILIIGPSQDQAFELFNRIKNLALNSGLVAPYIQEALMTRIEFTNGSIITARTAGDTGDRIRGKTVHVAIEEEAELIKDDVEGEVIMPMLLTTQGKVIKIGTPKLKNHLYSSLNSPRWKAHKVQWNECPLVTEEFIAEQKARLTDMQFRQEYMAEFVEEADSYFSESLIQTCISEHKMVKL